MELKEASAYYLAPAEQQLPKGYKQTELGMIPEDWGAVDYVSIGLVIDGDRGVHYPSAGELQDSGDCLFLNAGNVTKTGFRFDDCQFISREKDKKLNKGKLERGDVVLTTRGTIGNFAYFSGKIPFDEIRINSGMVILRNTSARIDTVYQYLVLNSPTVASQIERLSFGSAQPQLSVKGINALKIPLPPTKAEQEAIAEALNDANALIESLEQLIAKKRQLKQGAMQELLMPKDGWRPTNLGDIADPNQRWSFTGGPFGSNLKSSDYTDDGIRIIQLQNIGDGEFKNDYELYTSAQKADELISCNIYPGEIVLSKMGDPVARACIIPRRHKRYLMCSDGIRLAVNQKTFDTYFICTLINAPEFRTKAANAGTGSTRKRIGLNELRNLMLLCPPLSEQSAIAQILSDMDSEITELETKLAKTRAVKQGMMQQLLTGKIRLV